MAQVVHMFSLNALFDEVNWARSFFTYTIDLICNFIDFARLLFGFVIQYSVADFHSAFSIVPNLTLTCQRASAGSKLIFLLEFSELFILFGVMMSSSSSLPPHLHLQFKYFHFKTMKLTYCQLALVNACRAVTILFSFSFHFRNGFGNRATTTKKTANKLEGKRFIKHFKCLLIQHNMSNEMPNEHLRVDRMLAWKCCK